MSVDGSNTDVINQQLREQLVIVMNRIQELEDRDRQRQNGHNVGQQPANANGNTIKAAKPPMYSGDIGTDVEAWLFQVGQYAYVTNIPEAHRTKWAATYLTGKAATWWRGQVVQHGHANVDGITWDQFHEGMIAMFKPVNAKKIARDKLAALRQTHSVAKYNFEITQLFLEIGDVGDNEKLDKYVRGLKDKIRLEVELTEPTTLKAAMTKAQRVDGITYHTRMVQTGDYTTRNTYSAPTSESVPMELGIVDAENIGDTDADTLNAIGGRFSRPSNSSNGRSMGNSFNRAGRRSFTPRQRENQEVFRYCQQHRLCLNCKEPGHIARNCTKPSKPLNLRAQ